MTKLFCIWQGVHDIKPPRSKPSLDLLRGDRAISAERPAIRGGFPLSGRASHQLFLYCLYKAPKQPSREAETMITRIGQLGWPMTCSDYPYESTLV